MRLVKPPGRSNGEPQKEKTELLLQPTPGRGLVYTGWPWGAGRAFTFRTRSYSLLPLSYIGRAEDAVGEAAVGRALRAAQGGAVAAVQRVAQPVAGAGRRQVAAIAAVGRQVRVAVLVAVLRLGEAQATRVLRIAVRIARADLGGWWGGGGEKGSGEG